MLHDIFTINPIDFFCHYKGYFYILVWFVNKWYHNYATPESTNMNFLKI